MANFEEKQELIGLKEKLIILKEKGMTGKPSIDRPWERFYSKNTLTTEFPISSVYSCIYEQNKNHLGRIALNYYGRKISYGELFEKIEEAAKAFKENGIKKGDIVTISMPTTPETVYMFYALSKIGAISNMIDPRTSEEGIKHYLNEVDSKLLVVLDVFNKKISNIVDDTSIEKIINVSASDSLPLGMNIGYQTMQFINGIKGKKIDVAKNDKNINWNQFIDSGKNYSGITEETYEKNTPVSIVHTGGTTGVPKGVLLSNDSFNAIAYQYKTSGMHLLPGQKFLDIMPPFIAYGLGCGIHMPLVVGMTAVLIPNFVPKDFANYIVKYEPNHLAGVPSHWENLLNSKKLKNKDLSFLITPAVGGDGMDLKLEEEASQFLQEHNAPNNIIKGYGITEECSLAAACINDINKLGSVGIPLPQNVISIFEPDTENELDYGEKGEICITGPTLMLGYYNNQEASDAILKKHADGKTWIHTQDIGYMTEDGFLYVDGRIKRVIIRHDGFKVFPFLIEKTIAEHRAVKSCMVVGIPDTEHSQGYLPKAHIILKDEYKSLASEIEKEIYELCKKVLPEYVVPCEYKFRDEFPVTAIGKVDFKSMEAEDANKVEERNKVLKKIK